MRATEIYPIGSDAIVEGLEYVRLLLQNNPHLFNESSETEKLSTFLKFHLAHSDKPIINEDYIPISITTYSFAKSLLVKTLSGPAELIEILDHNRAYRLLYKDRVETFPQNARTTGDMTQYGLLYKSTENADMFLTMLKVAYSDWDIKINKLS